MAGLSALRRSLFIVLAAFAALLAVGLVLASRLPEGTLRSILLAPAKALLAALVVILVVWLPLVGLRRFLWRVGRRLAFSYFLIGVLPIPMVVLLAGLNTYLLSGYFLGYLYRDAAQELKADLAASAELALAEWSGERPRVTAAAGRARLAYYRDGAKVAGTEAAPAEWPAWLESEPVTARPRRPIAYAVLPDGSPALAAVARGGRRGVVAVSSTGLEQFLTRRSGVWVELLRADDPRLESLVRLSWGGREFTLLPLGVQRALADRDRFFGVGGGRPGWLDRPLLWWGEVIGEPRRLAGGEPVSDYVAVSLNSNLRTVREKLSSSSGEVDTAVWAGLFAVTGLLSSLYALAVLMALWIIVGLSRAVNRLSRATNAVRAGDFSVRIHSRRRDQIGELEGSFNEMTANLERAVDDAASQEALQKELAIARDLQQSLLPADLPASRAMEFSTLFEPSAAIGGDYFDILRVDGDRLAVVVADVSGHGLPTGLRMAMLKAALVILVEERKPAEEILRRLNGMVRAEKKQRFFVTATIAVIDFRADRLQLTNAAHPPSYLLRGGWVEEILLTGSPLGALGEEYGRRELALEPGDVLVWLSDGLIEAASPAGEPFGYDRIEAALAGPADSARGVRDRLLAAIRAHAAGQPADDDRTLVVMRYRPETAVSSGDSPRKP